MKSYLPVFAVLIVLCCQFSANASPANSLHADPQALNRWQDLRVGIMISWGPVTLTGKEIGWSRYTPHICDWHPVEPEGLTPIEVYDKLYTKWNPASFNPDNWVKLSKQAGMKYLVFITKHMDGFCLFETDYTDYKITSPKSPYGKDITQAIATACHEGGLAFSPYYCISDWKHPNYCDPNQGPYLQYVKNQTRELCTNYGPIPVMWFDNAPGRMEPFRDQIKDIHQMVYQLQPGAVINDRFILSGDYATAEQRVGEFREEPWETCMTLGGHWSWNPNDKIKPLKECIQSLVLTVGSNGNFLIGVGPDPNGSFEPGTAARLREIGSWLSEHGPAIYATRGGPFKPDFWSAATYRKDSVFLHILDWQGKETKTLPPIDAKITKARTRTGGNVTVNQTSKYIEISLPQKDHDQIDTIVELTLDKPAKEVEPADTIFGPYRPTAVKYSSYDKTKQDGWDYTGKAVLDESFWSYWRSARDDKNPWIELTFPEPVKINAIRVVECFDSLKRYKLSCEQDGKWIQLADVQKIHPVQVVTFPLVEAQKFRFDTLESDDLTTMRQMQFFRTFDTGRK